MHKESFLSKLFLKISFSKKSPKFEVYFLDSEITYLV
jgi:hypothetical protein